MSERSERMTAGKLRDYLKNVPDDVAINVTDENGKMTANIEFWFEDLDTRQFVELIPHTPFYELGKEEKEEMEKKDAYCWSCGKKKDECGHPAITW